MRRRSVRALAAVGLVAGLAVAGCGGQPPAPTAAPPPSTPAAPATTTTGFIPPGVPTEGVRPDTSTLSLAAEPRSAPVPTSTPPGRQVQVGGTAPEGVVVDPVTRTVAVAKRDPNELVLLDADTGAIRARTPLPGFVRHLQLAGPGGPVLVPVESANAVVRVNLPGGDAEAPVVVGTVPHDVTQAPNGTVMAADELGGTVSAVRGDQVVKVFTDAVQPAGVVPVGNIVGLVDVRKNTFTTYDVDALRIVGEVPSGQGPTHLVADRHGRMIATDTRGDTVIVFEPTGGPNGGPREVARVAQPGGPYGITYDPVRDRLYVASSGTNEVVAYAMTAPQPREVGRVATVQNPDTLGVDPLTGRLYVAGVSTGVVQIVDPPA